MTEHTHISTIKAANITAGQHWFSASTTGFFGSRYSSRVWAGRFFIESSCMFNPNNRLYTIRYVNADGTIDLLCLVDRERPWCSVNCYGTRGHAVRALEKFIAALPASER